MHIFKNVVDKTDEVYGQLNKDIIIDYSNYITDQKFYIGSQTTEG